MFEKAQSGRDAFTFSLRGMTTIASYGPAPVIADDRINKVIDQNAAFAPAQQPGFLRKVEDALARIYAPACCSPVA